MINRRQFLKTASAGALSLMASTRLFLNNSLGADGQFTKTASGFEPDLDIELAATPAEIPIYPGRPTQVWRFMSKLIKGDPNKLIEIPGSYLGPIIKANTGDKVRIRCSSRIPDETIVHWHGLHVPAEMDGHPRYAIRKGQTYLYEFQVKNRAGTYWYHPHPHGRTGHQVYGGLAGLFIVSDSEERASGLPAGEYDVPIVIQDRFFDNHNQLIYNAGNRMELMNGVVGDRILINGKPDFVLPVSTRSYRLRLLNGSNSRIYKLAWQDGSPLIVIGTDGGLLEKPVQRQYLFLGPGERIELYADFSGHSVDQESTLVSLPFDAGTMGMGMMGRGMGFGHNLPNGAGFTVLKIKVMDRKKGTQPLPARLSKIDRLDPGNAINFSYPRRFYLTMGHMQWTINGRTFQMEEVADDEIVKLGSLEVWEFYNRGGGMGMMGMMQQPHPIHLHGKQFQVLERSGVGHNGYVDQGWKDTVLLMPGERIRILVPFEDYPGLFLYHCHNLEHEDMGMMRNYLVKA